MERRKGSRQDHQSGKLRKDVKKKRKQPLNQHQAEKEKMNTSIAVKKLKNKHEVFVPEEETFGYRILNFFNVLTQNNNESINHVIWKIAPKEVHSGLKIVEIAANIAVCIFNEGARSILYIMQILDVKTGRNAHCCAVSVDTQCIRFAERSATRASKEARTRLTQQKKKI
ncbi:hypothetical protein EVAR_82075_1 [Eumeta japonica]|uniref:Uncharacterized protein n=1 Tax=Eumeta variegata TaxID=151549 RepID=A0A4C1U1L8_EUMVA|nr:hypothetical protein EVAR_82075_1 [Eumeta japonica]